jgi:hypothetical protein
MSSKLQVKLAPLPAIRLALPSAAVVLFSDIIFTNLSSNVYVFVYKYLAKITGDDLDSIEYYCNHECNKESL